MDTESPKNTWFTPDQIRQIKNYRSLWLALRIPDDDDEYVDETRVQVVNAEDANLIGSSVSHDPTLHEPVLDIDFPITVVPSSSPGHYHLYINKAMPWKDYQKLIKVLGEVGILEEAYAKLALQRKQTFVRIPGLTKDEEKKKPKRRQLRSCY